MARDLKFINVVDVESTCWEGDTPAGENSEIIEIGITQLSVAALEVHDKKSILCLPVSSRVSKFCTELTTITQQMLDENGIRHYEAFQILKKEYRSKDRVWASYGDYDRRMFEKHRDYPFGTTHLNVKNLFALTFNCKREVGMFQALEKLGLPLLGTHHRADDDSWNIAHILAALFKRLRNV